MTLDTWTRVLLTGDGIEKKSFAVSQYSGPLSYGSFKHESHIPPFTAPPLKTAGPPSEKKVGKMTKVAEGITPVKQLSSSQSVGRPMMPPPGPSISQISKPVGYGEPMPGTTKVSMAACADEIEKIALIERLVRLGAHDIPKTPRLLMKKRSPEELRALQEAVESRWNKAVTDPILNKVTPAIGRIPENVITKYPKKYLQYGSRLVAEDPIGITAAQFSYPGTTEAYIAGKKLLEKAIDKSFPLPPRPPV